MPTISVIAPAHNEEGIIETFVRRASDALRTHNLDGEILIIDDGSTDETGKILERLKKELPRLHTLKNAGRRGITHALRRGFEAARGDIFMFFCSDMESDPFEDIPKLLGPLREGYDIAAGWRANKTEGKIKIISSRLFNWLVKVLFGVRVHDIGWVKAVRRGVIEEIEPLRSDWHRFLLVFAAERGFSIKEVPLNFYPRKTGKSKFGKTGVGRAFGALIDLLVVKFLMVFSKKPMRVFGTAGVISFLLGFAGGVYLSYLKITIGHIGNQIPLLFLTALLITIGIQLFAFGFLAEIIASVKDRMR